MGNFFSDCCKEDKIENQPDNNTKIPLLDNTKNSKKNKTVKWNDQEYYRTIKTARNIRKKYKKSKSW
uniref:Uncharacterized protein n=1 Tax=viral metagenome TaxID=1070528 RepID=A0A6C0JR99_9ZZZZ